MNVLVCIMLIIVSVVKFFLSFLPHPAIEFTVLDAHPVTLICLLLSELYYYSLEEALQSTPIQDLLGLYISTDVSTYEVLTGWKFPAAHEDSPALSLEIPQSLILSSWRNVFIHKYYLFSLFSRWLGSKWDFLQG